MRSSPTYQMHYKPVAILFSLLALISPTLVQSQAFEVTDKPVEMTWPTKDWNGRHSFSPVFCLTYPNPQNALALTQVMFNQNTLYLARTTYNNNIAIYIATSVIPVGRSSDEDVAKMLESNQLSAQSAPTEIMISELSSDFGPTAGLVIRNAIEGNAAAPFPFVRRIAKQSDGNLRSLSVHRLFAHGPDRIEVAGLHYFASPIQGAKEQEVTAELSSIVDSVVKSLQTCTAAMPIRVRK